MFDISQFDPTDKANQGSWMEVMHPETGTPVGAELLVLGTDSKVWDQKMTEISRKRSERWRSQGGVPDFSMTHEEIKHNLIEILVACTLDWKGMLKDGEPLECNEANKRMVFTNLSWLRRQVDAFMGHVTNFLGEQPTTSKKRSKSS